MTAVLAPVAGLVLPMERVDDPVFAAEMVGSGVALTPQAQPGVAVAPVSGVVAKAHPHAFVILTDAGVGVLVHLGIGTVKLRGEGFTVLVEGRTRVEAGQEITRWDPADVVARGLDPTVVVCVMDTAPGSVTSPVVGDRVAAGDALFDLPA